jgi:hypothetical protein
MHERNRVEQQAPQALLAQWEKKSPSESLHSMTIRP